MKILTIQSRACIENAVSDFGTPEQQVLWSNWSERHPDCRKCDNDPDDDGSGEMPDAIRDLIISALHARYDFMLDMLRAPVLTPNEVTYYASIAGIVYATACCVSVACMHWRTF